MNMTREEAADRALDTLVKQWGATLTRREAGGGLVRSRVRDVLLATSNERREQPARDLYGMLGTVQAERLMNDAWTALRVAS